MHDNNEDCVDLGEAFITLDDCDGCPDCADCRAGCCPIWLKMVTEVRHFAAPLEGSPTGGVECWDYEEVVEVAKQAQIEESTGNAIYAHRFHGYRDGYYIDMTATCRPGLINTALGVDVRKYQNHLFFSSQQYSYTGFRSPAGLDCNAYRCHDPLWLAGFWYHTPSLVYQGPNKLFSHDPTEGIPEGADPDCCSTAGFNNGCLGMFAAGEATWGGNFKRTALQSNTGPIGQPAGCQISGGITSVSLNGLNYDTAYRIPAGTIIFPGFEPILDHTICRNPPPTPPLWPSVDMSFSYRCDGTVYAFVFQRDDPGCTYVSSPGCGYPNENCCYLRRQFGSYTSPPGQTLPFSVRIPTVKNTLWVTSSGTINITVPGPGVDFTLDWMP